MTTLETELDALLDRIGAEDPEAVRRVRGALETSTHTWDLPASEFVGGSLHSALRVVVRQHA